MEELLLLMLLSSMAAAAEQQDDSTIRIRCEDGRILSLSVDHSAKEKNIERK